MLDFQNWNVANQPYLNLFNMHVHENLIILVLVFWVICYILSLPFLLFLLILKHLLKRKKKKSASGACELNSCRFSALRLGVSVLFRLRR